MCKPTEVNDGPNDVGRSVGVVGTNNSQNEIAAKMAQTLLLNILNAHDDFLVTFIPGKTVYSVFYVLR